MLLGLRLCASSSPLAAHPHRTGTNVAALLLLLPLCTVIRQCREVVPEASPVLIHVRARRGLLLPFVALDETVETITDVLAGLLCLFGELRTS